MLGKDPSDVAMEGQHNQRVNTTHRHSDPQVPMEGDRIRCARLFACGYSPLAIADMLPLGIAQTREWIRAIRARYQVPSGRNIQWPVILAFRIQHDPEAWIGATDDDKRMAKP